MLILALLFIAVPLVEIYFIIQVGQAIGPLWTIALLVAASIAGARLLRWQGGLAWRRFQATMQAGQVPHREVLDGALIITGGVLLLTPGFITDLFGLALLLPPGRAVARRAVIGLVTRHGALRWTRVVMRSRPARPRPPRPQPEQPDRLPPG